MTDERRAATIDAIQWYYQSRQGTAEDKQKRRRKRKPRHIKNITQEAFGGLLADVELAIDEGCTDD